MLKIDTLCLGSYATNCYIVREAASQSCVVIDPGYDPERILSFVTSLGLTVEAIALTHGHFDHVGGVKELVEATGCKLWMSQSDWSQPKNPVTAYLYPIANCDYTEVWFCEEGETLSAGGLELTVMATPGHTPGSVCFLCGDALFSGDTLFAGSCGRTDLPGGSWATIQASLRRLAALEKDYTVYPGHGESSTLAREKRYNPYLR